MPRLEIDSVPGESSTGQEAKVTLRVVRVAGGSGEVLLQLGSCREEVVFHVKKFDFKGFEGISSEKFSVFRVFFLRKKLIFQ